MSAELLRTERKCRACGASLTLEEMHYFEDEDGSATCDACESAWNDAVGHWLLNGDMDYPSQP